MTSKSKSKPKSKSNPIIKASRQRMDKFCLAYIASGIGTQAAIEVGVPERSARFSASKWLRRPDVQARIAELRQKTEDATVMSILERKQRLTEIGRAKLTDFMELGADGTWCNIGPESKSAGAVQEITSRTEYDDDSATSIIHTKVKLHDPVKAIDLLNKMDKIYADNTGTQVNIDNRTLIVNVVNRETDAMVKLLEAGTLPTLQKPVDNNGHHEG